MSFLYRPKVGFTKIVAMLVFMLMLSFAARAASNAPVGHAEPLRVYLFASSTCSGCKGIKQKLLPRMRKRYGDSVRMQHVPVDDVEHFKLQLLYEKRYGTNDNEALKVFVGKTCLSGEKAIWGQLEKCIEQELAKGHVTPTPEEVRAEATKRNAKSTASDGGNTDDLARERFSYFKPMAIAAAGLIDGINPCAFTTLVFFISLLSSLGKRKRQLLVVGACFAFSVFATYLALGFGALKAIKVVSVTSGVSSGLTLVAAVFALILGAYSFYDFVNYQRTKDAGDIKLKLPQKIRNRVRKIMSRRMRTHNLVVGALSLGVVVSLLESVCTGQVYLPTLVCVARDPNLACHAWGCLLLYNGMFIVPLLVVFGLAYCGVTSERMAALSRKHLGLTKLLLAILFLGLGVVLIGTII